LPTYEWKRKNVDDSVYGWEYTTTQGSIHDPVPVPEGEGWRRTYSYQVGKVSGVGDSPSRSVKSQ
jgi:hypothetical protein